MTNFDLDTLESELRIDEAYAREGHTARTVVRAGSSTTSSASVPVDARAAERRRVTET